MELSGAWKDDNLDELFNEIISEEMFFPKIGLILLNILQNNMFSLFLSENF